MCDAFIGEIRIFTFDIVPSGWLPCNGQLVSISAYNALYQVIGTQFGGDGTTTFAIPDLRGRAPLMAGQGTGLSSYSFGQTGGQADVTLTVDQIPAHTHRVQSNAANGNSNNPTGNVWATAHTGKTPLKMYSSDTSNRVALSDQAFATAGANESHTNMPPFLVGLFCIAYQTG